MSQTGNSEASVRQIFGFWYALLLLAGLAIAALTRVNDGALLILSFDGDAVHMAQIVLRMVSGDLPHQDFVTPLGAMAFLPIVWLVNMGFGVGAAFAYAPVFIGLFLFPAIFWVGMSRFSPSGALVFGALVLVQLTALVHGGQSPTVSASMYYNNWCWAVAAIVVSIGVLPCTREGRVQRFADPVILGLGMAFLVLTKITFAVFLMPAVVIAVLFRGETRLLVQAIILAIFLLALISIPLGGIGFWQGYVKNLVFVAGSPARAQPGDPLVLMMLRPQMLVAVFGIVAGFLFLRQARAKAHSLVFLVLAVGWMLVTHQNWQNDPHWLVLAGMILIVMGRDVVLYNRFGWPLGTAIRVVAVGLISLGAPLWITQVQSLLIHSGLQTDRFSSVLVDPRHQDLQVSEVENARFWAEVPNTVLDRPDGIAALLNGEVLLDCQKVNGLMADLVASGAALDRIPETSGKQLLYADWVNALWLFSETEPLQGGAPWYYGGATGFEAADFLVVPFCPMGLSIRRIILEQVVLAGLDFEEVRRNAYFILLRRKR